MFYACFLEGGGGGGVGWVNGVPTGIPRVTIETSFTNPAPSTGFSNLSQNPEFPSPAPGCDKPGGSHLPVEITGAALEQHDQLFYSQLLQLRQQQVRELRRNHISFIPSKPDFFHSSRHLSSNPVPYPSSSSPSPFPSNFPFILHPPFFLFTLSPTLPF